MLHTGCITKNVFSNEFQILFYKVYSLIFKGIILKTINSILHYANKALWPIYKVLLEN
jgi:hypothetical protein